MDDPKIKLLAFEDRAHFVNVLCMKCKGDLDTEYRSNELRERAIAMQLQLSEPAAAEAKRRLLEVGLIDEKWHPITWAKNQKPSDHSAAERQRKSRRNKQSRSRNTHVTEDVTTRHSDSHNLDIDKDRDKDKEEEALRASSGARAAVAETNTTKPERKVTPEAAMAIELRNGGVTVTSMNPVLLAWVRDGVTIDQALDALKLARMRKPHPEPIAPAYLDKIIRERPRESGDALSRLKWRPSDDQGGTNATV